ncbi:AtzE family amidohydrolase [Opitutales bacterium ASA1]|uniref:AtzE family amidohydrolase n=1 Tax=Congregicoccus parvus TaxID=3081749 RepID=UPI002B2E95D4|nr:AtzE family amidohydrolase [Opitutales bacterium ASA1]
MTFQSPTATGAEIAAAVRERRVTAREVTEETLARVADTHTALNAFTTVTAERALAEADVVDAAVAAGRDPGPLAGVPYSVKNLFDLEGVVTVAGSKINRDDPPARADATCVARLRAAGAVCLGAVNMGEYAYDFVTQNAHDGTTRNPRDLQRSAGGSSGGSGAAVAAGLGAISIGTDTNGSIRVPSSFCGVWGLKPTYGRLSRAGAFPFVDSLDAIGPLARCVADLATCFDVMQGPDPRDPVVTSRAVERIGVRFETQDESSDLRIATLGGYFGSGGEAEVHEAVARVARALGVGREVELPQPALARTAAYLITAAEGGALHRERLLARAEDFDPAARDRLIAGALAPAAWYVQAQKFRAWWKEQVARVFREVDVLIAPATPIRAPIIGQSTLVFAGRELPLRPNIGVFTQPITLIGLPVVAAPIRMPDGLPVAVQLVGPPYSELRLLRVARALERAGVCAAAPESRLPSAGTPVV